MSQSQVKLIDIGGDICSINPQEVRFLRIKHFTNTKDYCIEIGYRNIQLTERLVDHITSLEKAKEAYKYILNALYPPTPSAPKEI